MPSPLPQMIPFETLRADGMDNFVDHQLLCNNFWFPFVPPQDLKMEYPLKL